MAQVKYQRLDTRGQWQSYESTGHIAALRYLSVATLTIDGVGELLVYWGLNEEPNIATGILCLEDSNIHIELRQSRVGIGKYEFIGREAFNDSLGNIILKGSIDMSDS
ncbi:hypothetical protein HON52_04750 [Candidatus Uhrbacteria bacterium]|jgi:hypothetical protein|nr:hypothetical protein [Candidatus Uhrbacteria bacterium]